MQSQRRREPEVKVLYSCHNLSADDFENGEDLSLHDAEKRRDFEGGTELMPLIKCENVSIGYEGQTVVKDLNLQ